MRAIDKKAGSDQAATPATATTALVDGNYTISDLVDTAKLGDLLQDFSQATGFTATLVSHPSLDIVVGSGWRDICTRFHRACPASSHHCRHSYESLTAGPIKNSEASVHHCHLGLVEGVMPILIKGRHTASLLTGQILFDKPDIEAFREQARTYQYDPADYLISLSEVPIVTEMQFRKALSFLAGLASMIGEMGLANLRLKESTAVLEKEIVDRKTAQTALAESERRFRSIVEASPMGMQMYRLEGDNQLVFETANQAADTILKVSHKQFVDQTIETAFPHLAETEIPQRYRDAARDGQAWESEKFTLEGDTVQSAHRLVAFQTAPGRMAAMFLDITDRKRSETELVASENYLRTILESTGDGILVVDRQGKVCLTNNRFAELWRIPSELIEAGDDDSLIAYVLGQLEDPEAFLAKVRDLYNTRDRDLDTLRFKDGRSFERFSSPLLEGNEVAGRVWSFRDVTQRNEAELALVASEKKYRSLIDSMPVGCAYHRMIYDDQGEPYDYEYLEVNGRFTDLTGVDPTGQTVRQAFPGIENDPADFIGVFGKVAQTGKSAMFEQHVEASDRWYDIVAYCPKPDHFGAVFIEITDRKRAEQALRESEAFLKKAQQMAHVGSWNQNMTGGSLEMSEEMYHILGLPPDRQLPDFQTLIDEMVHPDDRQLVSSTYRMEPGKEHDTICYRVVRPSGEVRWLEAPPLELKYGDKDCTQAMVLGTVQDITDRKAADQTQAQYLRRLKEANQKLTTQQKELEEFTYSISHDLKAPVVSINGFAGIVAERARGVLDATCARYLDRVVQNARVMESLLTDLLELSRIGRVESDPSSINMSELADEVIDSMSLRAEERQINLRRVTRLPHVTGLSKRIRQVVSNLIDNAIKYMPSQEKALIEIGFDDQICDPSGHAGAFFVRDNGIGIAHQFQKRIFGLFQRGPAAKSGATGTGVGLAATRRIVDIHGGYLWVHSAEDQGATFYFSLRSEKWARDRDDIASNPELAP